MSVRVGADLVVCLVDMRRVALLLDEQDLVLGVDLHRTRGRCVGAGTVDDLEHPPVWHVHDDGRLSKTSGGRRRHLDPRILGHVTSRGYDSRRPLGRTEPGEKLFGVANPSLLTCHTHEGQCMSVWCLCTYMSACVCACVCTHLAAGRRSDRSHQRRSRSDTP